MHPTVDEQLRGIDRLLRAVASDPGLSPDSTEALADASTDAATADGVAALRAEVPRRGQPGDRRRAR